MDRVQEEQRYFVHLLSSVLHGVMPQRPPENLDYDGLFRQSVRHCVANMVFHALQNLEAVGQLPFEVMQRFQKEHKRAVAKEATQHIAVEQILRDFEDNRIACMPLKGYLVKHLYPTPDLRSMADIDILFRLEQAEAVKTVMLRQGYIQKRQGGNHDVYYREPYMNVEMHRRLVSPRSPYSDYLEGTWDRAVPLAGYKHVYGLSREDFYIYLLIHLTKHYSGGGTGVRSFMDVWVYRNSYKDHMDWAHVETELQKVGLRDFAANVTGLCEAWFGGGSSNRLYEEMAAYILDSGAYGTRRHSAISSLSVQSKKTKMAPRFAYWLSLVFQPVAVMREQYPVLSAAPILLPICWGLRGIRCLLFRRKHVVQLLGNLRSVSEEDIARMRSLHDRSGLRNNGV